MANTQTTVPLFVANTVLTAASQNISAGTGVPVFATTVTRDAAFGGSNKALAEGQLCYIEASNVVQYYDGAAWATVGPSSASGLVPVVASSVTVASGTATLNTTTGLITATTASTISVNGVFSSAYQQYELITTGSEENSFRLRVGGVDASGANYAQSSFRSISDGSSGLVVSQETATSWSQFTMGQGTTSYQGTSKNTIINPFETTQTSFMGRIVIPISTPRTQEWITGGFHNSATSYTGFTLLTSSFTGTIRIYGYA